MSDNLRAEIEQWAKDWSNENRFDPGMEGLGELHAILDQDAIRTATPTPTPPLGDMIEAALVAHRGDFHQDDWWIICKCGQQWPVGGKVHSHEAYAAFAAHQALAVLAAISEAGAVEWGVQRPDGLSLSDDEKHAKYSAGVSTRLGNQATPVSRVTGPWTAVEG